MSQTATIEVAPASRGDEEIIGRVLARAFQDDPVFGWVVPDPARRRALLPAVFTAFAEAYVPHGETYLAGEGAAAALWAPPGSVPLSGARLEELGERLTAVLGADAGRLLEVGSALEAHRPGRPCAYLQLIGVVPEHRGRGLGGALLGTVLGACDAAGTPAYLEATSPDNRRLYARHGFEVVGEVGPPQGPPLWLMWREPAAW